MAVRYHEGDGGGEDLGIDATRTPGHPVSVGVTPTSAANGWSPPEPPTLTDVHEQPPISG